MGAQIKSLVVDLKKKAARAKSLLDFYNPDKYPASVLEYHKENWSLKIETAQIDLMEALFDITESVDGAANQEDLVECEEIVKNISEEAVKFTIQFTRKLLSLTAESDPPLVAASDEARAAVIVDQDKLDNDQKDPLAETKKIDFTMDTEVPVSGAIEEKHKFGCEVKDSMEAILVRLPLGDQAFVTFSASSGHKTELLTNFSYSRSQLSKQQMNPISGDLRELSAENLFGYIESCYTGPDLAIMDIVKPFILITRREVTAEILLSVAMFSAAATHGDLTDRTGIGGECRIASTEDLRNYYPVIVSSFKNVYVYSYTHLQVS